MNEVHFCATCGHPITGPTYVVMKRPGTLADYDYRHPGCHEQWLRRSA